jgi:integrase
VARRIKFFDGQKETKPIKDPKDIERLMYYLLSEREHAKTEVKRYQADRNWMMCLLGINTAFRAEDLLQLRVFDVIKGYVQIKENKTGKMQNFKMNKNLHQDIKEYVERNGLSEYDYMFMGQKKKQDGKNYSNPITRQRAHAVITNACEAVGIYFVVGMHGLRKTFGYHFMLNGGRPETLMKMYNHDSYDVTKRYVMWGIDDAEKSRTDTYIGGAHKK